MNYLNHLNMLKTYELVQASPQNRAIFDHLARTEVD